MLEAQIESAVKQVVDCRRAVSDRRSILVAITGVDGCGKGFIARLIVAALQLQGLRTANINVDGWLNLPGVRFGGSNPAEHFYLHAIRFDQLFSQLIMPLRDRRTVCVDAEFAEETATTYRSHRYEFHNIDVIVLEGIYLLKRAFQFHYDLSFWINCSVDSALGRAVARSQEGLSPEETIALYRKVYFPAQELHFRRDNPQAAATALIDNDPKLRLCGYLWSGRRTKFKE